MRVAETGAFRDAIGQSIASLRSGGGVSFGIKEAQSELSCSSSKRTMFPSSFEQARGFKVSALCTS